MIPTLDDERLVSSDYVPIRSALTAAAELREELAELAIWEVRVGYDGFISIELLTEDALDEAGGVIELADWWDRDRTVTRSARVEARRAITYSGTWRGADVRLVYIKPSRAYRAWLRITGRFR